MKFSALFAVVSTVLISFAPVSAQAAGDAIHIPEQEWSHTGLLGTYDREAAQRGFQVYKEVCAACHGLSFLSYRNLGDIGFSEAEVASIANDYEVQDGPNDEGEMFMRPGKPSDRFVGPFENEAQARASNNGAYPPDLSLITKARHDGTNYVYALLTGYEEAPEGVTVGNGMHYNKYFEGHQIAMAQPLRDGGVDYAEGQPEATLDQMAHDVSVFLAWAAEPKLEQRKQTGIKVLIYLLIFTAMLYAVKRKIWKDAH